MERILGFDDFKGYFPEDTRSQTPALQQELRNRHPEGPVLLLRPMMDRLLQVGQSLIPVSFKSAGAAIV
jgi:hypothetical protein